MAAPIIAAIKAGALVDKTIRNRIPGGYKTTIAMILVIVIFLPILIVNVLSSMIQFDGRDSELCMPDSVVESGFEIDEAHIKSGQSSPSTDVENGGLKPADNESVGFPTGDSTTIIVPVKGVLKPSYGPRKSFRTNNGMWTNPFHDGTDIPAPKGTPIVSMADGVVSMANNHTGKTAEGSMMEIRHVINGQKYTTAYRHIIGSSIKFKVGDTVKAGQQIASVGSEGYSTGPHLHFVVAKGSYHRYNSGKSAAGTIDPVAFLKSNGAQNASGGLTGDDFSEGATASPDGVSCTIDGKEEGLGGDGTTAWGEFQNGKFDEDELMEVAGIKLYNIAATDLKQMLDAYKKETGKTLNIKQGYLSFDEQKKLYKDGKQIEKAGQSIYGWARAVEFNIKDFSADEYKWLAKKAVKYGWAQPETYTKGGSSPQAGVWGYVGGNSTYPPPSNATAAANQEIAKKVIAEKYPEFNDADFGCLVHLWNGESNWNHLAKNPSSGAYGIVQALPASKMNSVATDWASNPATQIEWGLKYIKGRYKTPCGAWAFWNETDPAKKFGYKGHWY